MWDKIFELGHNAVFWLSSHPNQLRLRGARIEVIAIILCSKPSPGILLGKSRYHAMWMPPQEGVNLNETFEQALFRCLEVECGLDFPKNSKELSRSIYLRSIRYVGNLELPIERQGERPVASDVIGTPLEAVTLKQKAYWMATILINNQNDIKPKPDGRELLDLRWFSLRDARHEIYRTNHPDKAELLAICLDRCKNDLHGV